MKGLIMEDDEKHFRELTKKYFDFLTREYGFVYFEVQNIFDGTNIRVYVEQFDRTLPSISLWLKSEPKFTCITMDWLLEGQIDYSKMDKLLLEGCFEYYSNVFQKFSDQLVYNLGTLLLPGLKKLFVHLIKSENLTKNNYLANLSKENSKYYYYIKKMDRKWNPGKDL